MSINDNTNIPYLFDYIKDFLSISDLDTLLDKICLEAPKVINGKDCSIFLIPDLVSDYDGQLDRGDGTSISAEKIDKEFIVLAKTTREEFKDKIGKAFYYKGYGLTGWIFKNKKPLQIKNMNDENELKKIDKDLVWKDAYRGSEIHFPNKLKMPFIGVPLIKKNTILGVIRIGETLDGDSFLPYAIDVLMSFAGILANLIEKVTSMKNMESSLTSLINLGALSNSKQIFDAVVKEAASLVGAENCELYFLNRYGEKIILHATTGGYMEKLRREKKCKSYKRGHGLTGWIFKTGKPLRTENILDFKEERVLSDEDLVTFSNGAEINDESDRQIKWSDQDAQYKHHLVPHPYFLGVPIKSDIGEVIGVLRVSSPRVKAIFGRQDMQLLQDLANNISLIFHNERQNKLYDALIEIGNIYNRDKLFNYVVNVIPGLVYGRGCSIFLKQSSTDDSKKIVLAYTSSTKLKNNNDPKGQVIDLQYEYGQGKTGIVADIKRSLLINYYGSGKNRNEKMKKDFDTYFKNPNNRVCYLIDKNGNNVGITRIFKREDEPEFSDQEKIKFNDFCQRNIYERRGLPSNKHAKCETGARGHAQSYLAVPIKLKSKTEDLLGVIRIPRTSEGVRFSEEELILVESITGRLTSALEIERAMAKTSENLEILNDINSKINSSFDKDTIIEEILTAITEKLGFEFATIQLVSKKSGKDIIETLKGKKNSNINNAIDPQKWLGASHPLYPPKGQTSDIHVHVLMELEESLIVKGYSDNFNRSVYNHLDKIIYRKYKHKNLIRAFVPIIVVEPNTGEKIKIGTLEAGHNIHRKDFIEDQELEMIEAVANQVAITIWNRDQIWSRVITEIVHEVRNSHTTVRSSNEKMLKGFLGTLNSDQEEQLKYAVSAIREQENLLTNLLDFVGIVRDMTSLNRQEVTVCGMINDIYRVFKHSLKINDIKWVCQFQNNDLKISVDDNKIKQVLTNLVENAIKFTPAKGQIKISTFDDREIVRIIVEDTGKGIREEEKDKIFREFYQVPNPSGKCPGTGLGLSIAKNYVELHKGYISVESDVGKGSKFIIHIPKTIN